MEGIEQVSDLCARYTIEVWGASATYSLADEDKVASAVYDAAEDVQEKIGTTLQVRVKES